MSRAAELRAAVGFLTRLPAGGAMLPAFGACIWAFPLAGALIGLGTGAVLAGGIAAGLPPLVAAALAGAAGLWLTGGLHEDGLADLADGLSGGRTPERRLQIMRDSRIGAHGAAALATALAMRYGGWAALEGAAALTVPLALAMTSRAGLAVLLALAPPRLAGLGATAAEGATPARAGLAVTVAAAAALLFLDPAPALAVLAATAGAQAGVAALARRSLGSLNGDALGAAQVTGELAGLAAALALLRPFP